MGHVLISVGICALFLVGCDQPKATLAGGKPVSYWLKALHDPDVKMRKRAVIKLGNVGPTDPTALPALIGALKDPNAAVRSEAIIALLKGGSATNELLAALADVQRLDRDAKVRSYASQALENLRSTK